MAPMKRENQWDMFDVAVGACELDDYLNQRYQESDLHSKVWVEPSDRVDELRPPAPGTKEQVLIPIQGPGVTPPAPPKPPAPAEPLPSRPPWEAQQAEPALPSRPPWEAPSATPTPPAQPTVSIPVAPVVRPAPIPEPAPAVSEQQFQAPTARPEPVRAPEPEPALEPAPPAVLSGPDMAELLARFHQATKAYEERSKDEVDEESTDAEPESD